MWWNLRTSLLYFVMRVRYRCKESSRSLSHLLMSFLYFLLCATVYSKYYVFLICNIYFAFDVGYLNRLLSLHSVFVNISNPFTRWQHDVRLVDKPNHIFCSIVQCSHSALEDLQQSKYLYWNEGRKISNGYSGGHNHHGNSCKYLISIRQVTARYLFVHR